MTGSVGKRPGGTNDASVSIGGALPDGGSVGDVLTNTGPGEGDWDTPAGAGSVGYYATADIDFDAASHCMTLNIAAITGLSPPFGTFVLAVFPDTIERDIVEPVQMRTNVGGRERPLLDRDQNPVSASQLTPERVHFIMYLSPGYIFVDPLGLRPQDYLIWCGYSDTFVDVATPFYDASNFTDSFDTNCSDVPCCFACGPRCCYHSWPAGVSGGHDGSGQLHSRAWSSRVRFRQSRL